MVIIEKFPDRYCLDVFNLDKYPLEKTESSVSRRRRACGNTQCQLTHSNKLNLISLNALTVWVEAARSVNFPTSISHTFPDW